jgi:hypothetical protein
MANPQPLSALDFVNPYLSPRRQFVCTEMAKLAPNTVVVVASNNKATDARFQEWTGHTQKSLEDAWTREGFRKAATPEERKRGAWIRDHAGAVTTSCEGLIGKLFARIEAAGYGKRDGNATSFNLGGLQRATGKEPATARGWHWFRDRTKDVHPQPGDFFQVGRLAAPGQWFFHHVGVITGYIEQENPEWETVEAGQGGPGTGYDFLKRKGWRPMNPIDSRNTKKVLMGWLDIDEHFA